MYILSIFIMTKIHKKILKARKELKSHKKQNSELVSKVPANQRSRHSEREISSGAARKAGVNATIRSHDFRFKDEKTLEGLGLDSKSQKRMARVKKLVSKRY